MGVMMCQPEYHNLQTFLQATYFPPTSGKTAAFHSVYKCALQTARTHSDLFVSNWRRNFTGSHFANSGRYPIQKE